MNNVGHSQRYPSGASYRHLQHAGKEWKESKTILFDGRISEHSHISVPGWVKVTVAIDLKGTYFYENRDRVEEVSVAVSLDGKKWEDLGSMKTPYPILTHGTMAIRELWS